MGIESKIDLQGLVSILIAKPKPGGSTTVIPRLFLSFSLDHLKDHQLGPCETLTKFHC
jgi:hypothetical protein